MRSIAEDEAELRRHATALADAIEAALPGWVERCVRRLHLAYHGTEPAPALLDAARVAGSTARAEVSPTIRRLLASDIDDQKTNPMSILRAAVRYPTEVLAAAGIPPVERDEFSARSFPDDDYALTPASFADIDPAVHEPGLIWGAAKAHVHLRRRRGGGT